MKKLEKETIIKVLKMLGYEVKDLPFIEPNTLFVNESKKVGGLFSPSLKYNSEVKDFLTCATDLAMVNPIYGWELREMKKAIDIAQKDLNKAREIAFGGKQ